MISAIQNVFMFVWVKHRNDETRITAKLAELLSLCGRRSSARQLGQYLGSSVERSVAFKLSTTVRQIGMGASPVQGRAAAKPSLVPDRSIRIRVGRHLSPGNTAHPDRYGRSFMAMGLLIYGDKRCALSPLYASWLKAWKVR
ncbi:hypothetical protein AAC387_Pa06g2160 [Persea americana]